MFIKRSGNNDGKIVSVLDEDDLTEEQKKALKNMSKQQIKTSEDQLKPSDDKKSGS